MTHGALRAIRAMMLCALLFVSVHAHAQSADTAPTGVTFSGAATVTTQGISSVPALTLGRPATIFDLAVRSGAFGFEPQLRFDIDGTPWSFLLWGRYRAIEGDRFQLTIGAHPSFSFRRSMRTLEGAERDVIEVRRYVAGELTPTWSLTDRTSVGGYYLYSRGIDFGTSPHTHLVAARAGLGLTRPGALHTVRVAPQVYFLRTSGRNGAYFNASLSASRRDVPFSVSTMVNIPLQTDITGGQDVLWNLSLTWHFPR